MRKVVALLPCTWYVCTQTVPYSVCVVGFLRSPLQLGFSTHRKKRMRQIKKAQARGTHDPTTDDPFDLFVSQTDIRWCYYRDSHKILGQTFGMLVLQDFEAMTPNLLARTVETVEGGGLVTRSAR